MLPDDTQSSERFAGDDTVIENRETPVELWPKVHDTRSNRDFEGGPLYALYVVVVGDVEHAQIAQGLASATPENLGDIFRHSLT
jgi:hypothetical protein